VSYVLNQNHRGGGCHHGCDSWEKRRRPCGTMIRAAAATAPIPRTALKASFFRDPIYRGPCPPDPTPCDRDWANNILRLLRPDRHPVRG
jgi:hypothetical protein